MPDLDSAAADAVFRLQTHCLLCGEPSPVVLCAECRKKRYEKMKTEGADGFLEELDIGSRYE